MVGLPASDENWRAQCQVQFGMPPKTDLRRLAQHNGAVVGVIPVNRMTRLIQDLPGQPHIRELADIGVDGRGAVWYEFRGSSQQGRRPRVWLKVQALLTLTCQRCLSDMLFLVNETVQFELFANENTANAVEAVDEGDPDAPEPLVADGPVDLVQMVEDQLILAVPYVPKHHACEPAKTSAGESVEEVKRESPFKVLEGLKRGSK